jgi:hypothetical protein
VSIRKCEIVSELRVQLQNSLERWRVTEVFNDDLHLAVSDKLQNRGSDLDFENTVITSQAIIFRSSPSKG